MMAPLNLKELAMKLLSQNPSVANNPQAAHFMQVIESGDSVQGQKIAENLCKAYGVSREDAVNSAKAFFNLP